MTPADFPAAPKMSGWPLFGVWAAGVAFSLAVWCLVGAVVIGFF